MKDSSATMRVLLVSALAIAGSLAGCNRTETYCRLAAEERNRNDPAHAFPVDEFMLACRRLSADHAQCTIHSFAGSYAVTSARACTDAYRDPMFPRDILLGVPRAVATGAH